jgi:hypothetical protein
LAFDKFTNKFTNKERAMVLGMSVSTFTLVHVIISLGAIASGFVVMFGLLGSHRMSGITALFLATTILTTATGFLFPFTKLFPSHMIGMLALPLLAIAVFALYGQRLSGAWRWIYVVTAMLSLYLNVFILVVQSFLTVPALRALAPNLPLAQPPFAIAQVIVLVFFVIVIVSAVRRFRPTFGNERPRQISEQAIEQTGPAFGQPDGGR